MSKNHRTTREILEDCLPREERTPLYSPEALAAIRRDFKAWTQDAFGLQDLEVHRQAPKTVLGSDTPRDLVYTPLNTPDLDYQRDLGNPGQEPFTRGIHPDMYRGRKFTMRQLTGFGSAEDTNRRMRFMLDHGATGLNVLFDLPTIQMYDSDDPWAAGQVGMSGVAVDSVEDMQNLFKDIPLDRISVSIVTHYPSNTAILFPMFLAMAEERGLAWKQLRGSVQNDTTLEQLIRSGAEYIPPEACFRLQCDTIEYLRQQVPKWNSTTLNGYNLREFGTSAVTEMAVAAANGIATIEELLARGHTVDDIAGRLTFFWSVSNDFFEEIARMRAMRRLWQKIMKYRFQATSKRSQWMRCHVQTSGVALVQQEPLNNVIRSCLHSLAAILGGTQSLHVDSYDEAYSVPTEEAALLSLRTQQIIQEESGITEVVDPLGGSFYLEALTADLEDRILKELERIEQRGGYVQAIADGSLHREIVEYFSKQHADIEQGEIKIVAVNTHTSQGKPPPIDVFSYPEGVETRQRRKLAELRQARDEHRVQAALRNLKQACGRSDNILPFSLECARSRCTEGELFAVFKEAFGLWNPPALW